MLTDRWGFDGRTGHDSGAAEWRWLGLSTLAAAVSALVSECVRTGFAEIDRVRTEKREAARKAAEDSKAWRAHLEAP